MRLNKFVKGNYIGCIMSLMIAQISSLSAAETTIESGVRAVVQYNDNLFMNSATQDSVSNMIIAPSVKLLTKEENWDAFFSAKLIHSIYSEDVLNGTDQFYEAVGKYSTERNLYSISGKYNVDTNLDRDNAAVGIDGRKVSQTRWSIAPEYTRLLTERLSLMMHYDYTEADFDDLTATVPYKTDTIAGTGTYSLSERSKFDFTLTSMNYKRKDGAAEYRIFSSMVGLTHNLAETLVVNYSIGSSSVSLNTQQTQVFDFFGQSVVATQVADSNKTSLVFDAGIDAGWLTAKASRSASTDSYGVVNELDQLDLYFRFQMSELVRVMFRVNYYNTEEIGDNNNFGRTFIYYQPILKVALSKNLTIDATYRYTTHDYNTQTFNTSQDANVFYVGVSYAFPSVPVF